VTVAPTSEIQAWPDYVLMGLSTGDVPAQWARGHLVAVRKDFGPDAADAAAVDLARRALVAIRSGHRDAARLAEDVLDVCSAARGRWGR
jgi:hypothetical protein